MGNRVAADVTQYTDTWTDMSYARRQWGLIADQRPSTHPVAGTGAVDASAALQDFDGISYAKGSNVLKQLNASLGDDVFFAGVIDHFTRHRFGNATMHDLFESWERAGAGDLSSFTTSWLRTAGPDEIVLDREAGVIRRTPPAEHPADRTHTFRATVAVDGIWEDRAVEITGPETPFDVPDGAPVVLDAYDESWGIAQADPTTVRALVDLLPDVKDGHLRAGVWNNVRSALHNAAIDPADVLALAVASLPVEDAEDTMRRTMTWLFDWVVPLAPSERPVSCTPPRSTSWSRRRPGPSASSRRSGWRSARPTTPPSCAAGSPYLRSASTWIWTCAGRCWSGWPRSARPTATSSRPLSTTSRPPGRASRTPARSPRCPTLRPRPGRGRGSPARSTYRTTSWRPPATACGAAARRS